MKELEYPFDSQYIRRKKKALRRELLEGGSFIDKNIAILGGSTTSDVKDILELFLLNYGIKPNFYESEYAQYWQDAVFENEELKAFNPDIIYIHTSNRNLNVYPEISDTADEVKNKLDSEYSRYEQMWSSLFEKYNCPVIQNNFEYPYYRLLGNKDATDIHGKTYFVTRLNLKFAEYADSHSNFYINDINYQSASYGLDKWSDVSAWHMYKYALNLDAIPSLCFNVANIIKSIYGKNKKAIALDLDNTLWGGVVGDDGPENLQLGQETPMGQVYTEFQSYLKQLQSLGIILNVISKNEEDAAMSGLNHPQMILKPEDFISIKANWEPKSNNLKEMAAELSLLPEAFVFADDNPAEREIISQQVPGVGIPLFDSVEHYVSAIDKAGYFETTTLSSDDLKRNQTYKENAQRTKLESSFADYSDYLKSLEMKAVIKEFESLYMSRIAQLTNKSNQFNLTTLRLTQADVENMSKDDSFITLYGKLEDKFGDNGVVALTIAKQDGDNLEIILWLMSCRVLKRDMEYAMMNELVSKAKARNIKKIYAHYYPTAKNAMVKDFYEKQGFSLIEEDESGNKKYELDLSKEYINKNCVITVNGDN